MKYISLPFQILKICFFLSLCSAALILVQKLFGNSSERAKPSFFEGYQKGLSNTCATQSCSNYETFDFFILSQSWQPEFCYKKIGIYPGCSKPDPFWRENLTLHGLWPQNSDGSYPCCCRPEPFDPSVIPIIGVERLTRLWPNVKDASPGTAAYDSFWSHEWSKHGTCTSMTQVDYFDEALDFLQRIGTPALVAQRQGQTVTHAELSQAYGGPSMAVFKCMGTYFSQAYLCLAKDLTSGSFTQRIECPASALSEGNCGPVIKIATFETPEVSQRLKVAPSIENSFLKMAPPSEFYLFAMLWQPGVCQGAERNDPGCRSPRTFWNESFTIHGLWPDFFNGSWPQFCRREPLKLDVINKIGLETMRTVWPNVAENESSSNYSSFWEHEWDKHGTCTGMTQEEYFTTTVDVFLNIKTPAIIIKNIGKKISPNDIRDALGGNDMVVLGCDENNNFFQAFVCLQEKDMGEKRMARTGEYNRFSIIPCPLPTKNEDTCTSHEIYIPYL